MNPGIDEEVAVKYFSLPYLAFFLASALPTTALAEVVMTIEADLSTQMMTIINHKTRKTRVLPMASGMQGHASTPIDVILTPHLMNGPNETRSQRGGLEGGDIWYFNGKDEKGRNTGYSSSTYGGPMKNAFGVKSGVGIHNGVIYQAPASHGCYRVGNENLCISRGILDEICSTTGVSQACRSSKDQVRFHSFGQTPATKSIAHKGLSDPTRALASNTTQTGEKKESFCSRFFSFLTKKKD